ncbi:MAG: hemolysin family protein [Eubacteriales bacterium]|jgi:putative hemolysin|nr:hemolysin family protein [Eubacteriales bacterium]
MPEVLRQFLFQLTLIFANAIFACAEIAVISVSEPKLQKLSEDGDKRATRLLNLTQQPARFLSTIQIGITLAGFLASAFAAGNFAGRLVDLLTKIGVTFLPRSTMETIAVVVVTVILSYFTLILGELVPKRIAMKKPEQLALAMSWLIVALAKLFSPVVSFLTVSTNFVLRLMGIDPHGEDEEITEEEIRMLLDTGIEAGTILHEENEMIKNIFEFNDKIAEDVMTHRTEVSVLWIDETLEDWEKTITETRHTRYPVCNENTDDVVGVLNIKDFYRVKHLGFEAVKKEAINSAFFVPETIKTDVLFRDMQKSRKHFAVVLDEYGGMSGIVTISDLIEEIVGDIDDGDKEEIIENIEPMDSQTWKIRGITPLEEVVETLDVKLPLEDYETFGGLIFGLLNYIPDDGATPEVESFGLNIKVKEIKDHRVEYAIVCKTE